MPKTRAKTFSHVYNLTKAGEKVTHVLMGVFLSVHVREDRQSNTRLINALSHFYNLFRTRKGNQSGSNEFSLGSR